MKKLIFFILFVCSFSIVFSQKKVREISILPEPVSITRSTGFYKLPDQITVSLPDLPELNETSKSVLGKLAVTGKKVSLSNRKGATIRFILTNGNDKDWMKEEGYYLSVKADGIEIIANKPAGLFYGAQTLWQLMPKEIENETKQDGVEWEVPMVVITDYPRFAWRGLMFDVSRHFFTKKEVKDFIDQMVQYKFNLLHLHLTDDEGWRVEIKSLPRLTTAGAWNVKREGYFGTFAPIPNDEPRHFGGFYSQEDIKDIVKYAQIVLLTSCPK